MDELFKEWRDAVLSRLRNPLLVAVVIAWPLWNYRLVLVVIGDGKFAEKIAFIDGSLFTSTLDRVLHLAIGPLTIALLYTFVWPWFDRKIKVFALRQQNETMKAELEEQHKTPMDAEAQALLIAKHEAELKRRDNAIASLNALVLRERAEYAEARDRLSAKLKVQAANRLADHARCSAEAVLKMLQGTDRNGPQPLWNEETRLGCIKALPLSHVVPLSRFVLLTDHEPRKDSGELVFPVRRAIELLGAAPQDFIEVLEAAGLGVVDRWGEFFVHIEEGQPRQAVCELHRTLDPEGYQRLKESLRDQAMRRLAHGAVESPG